MSNQLSIPQILKITKIDKKIAKLTKRKKSLYEEIMKNIKELEKDLSLEELTYNLEEYQNLKNNHDLVNSELLLANIDQLRDLIDKMPNKK